MQKILQIPAAVNYAMNVYRGTDNLIYNSVRFIPNLPKFIDANMFEFRRQMTPLRVTGEFFIDFSRLLRSRSAFPEESCLKTYSYI